MFARTRGGGPRDPSRVLGLLERLGVPMPRAVVHVVGTNGKGTVAARIDAGLRATGRRTVLFTSPHVESITERITVHGRAIDPRRIVDFVQRVRGLDVEDRGAFFEWMLVLALEEADAHGAHVVVLEAGVGAAFDATLPVGPVIASVLTTVGEDHLDTIGPTLADVAKDKSAALRPGVPAVTGATGMPLAIVRDVARTRGVPLTIVDPVPGDVEGFTTQLAVATLAAIGIDDPKAVHAATRPTGLPARRERFRISDGVEVVLDGAHNLQAIEALLDEPFHDLVVLLGVATRKRAHDLLDAVRRRDPRHVVLTQVAPDDAPWGTPRDVGIDVVPDPIEALRLAASHAHDLHARTAGDRTSDLDDRGQPVTLLVTGSFYLAGAVRPLLRSWSADPRLHPSWYRPPS